MLKPAIAVLLLIAPAAAQGPSEVDKAAVLNRAYAYNGNRMVGWGSIDLTGEPIAIRTTLVEPSRPEPIKEPVKAPAVKIASAEKPERNICTRHGMHKVTLGRTWRCRR
jgi:hypothetical protein